jgi:hypothetical protein
MSWLAIHIWVELLVAAAFGGLIGWALHARRAAAPVAGEAGAARIVELETQLRQDREELGSLREKLKAAGASPAQSDTSAEATLAWRNRYLESRVRFLESKVDAPEQSAGAVKPGRPDEAMRLRWRNRYLEGRARYLEEELKAAGALPPAEPAADTLSSGDVVEVAASDAVDTENS